MVVETLVGENTAISGNVGFSGGFHIDGYVKGNVEAEPDSDSTLSVSELGCIEGDVRVPNVFLSGTVKGDVRALGRVELGASAKVIGDVYYNLIEMAIGAEINGKLIHHPQADPGEAREQVRRETVAEEDTVSTERAPLGQQAT
jgi:cytoskeletal protein CcmA (bactofilin family)